MKLHQPEVLAKYEQHGASLLVVSFAPHSRYQHWPDYWWQNFLHPTLEKRGHSPTSSLLKSTRFIHDPDLATYRAYSLGRYSPLKVYGPKILAGYARRFVTGQPVKATHEDPLQRGGDFIIGRDGRILLAHSGEDQAERPSLRALVNALAKTND